MKVLLFLALAIVAVCEAQRRQTCSFFQAPDSTSSVNDCFEADASNAIRGQFSRSLASSFDISEIDQVRVCQKCTRRGQDSSNWRLITADVEDVRVVNWSASRTESATQTDTDDSTYDGSVMEIAVRKVNDCPDCMDTFVERRTAFINLLRQQTGVQIDGEFKALLDADGASVDDVFIGMTQYESLDAFNAIQEVIGSAPETTAFFESFTLQCFVIVKPGDENQDVINLGSLGTPDCNVIRLAIRDLTTNSVNYRNALADYNRLTRMLPGVIVTNNYDSLINDQRASTTMYTDMDGLTSADENLPEDSTVKDTFLQTFNAACYYVIQRLY